MSVIVDGRLESNDAARPCLDGLMLLESVEAERRTRDPVGPAAAISVAGAAALELVRDGRVGEGHRPIQAPCRRIAGVQPEAGARVAIGRTSTSARSTAVASDVGVDEGTTVGGAVIGDAVVVGAGEGAGWLGTPAIDGDDADDGDPAVVQADRTTVPRMMAVSRRMRSGPFLPMRRTTHGFCFSGDLHRPVRSIRPGVPRSWRSPGRRRCTSWPARSGRRVRRSSWVSIVMSRAPLSAERVADRDRPAVDVHLRGIEAELVDAHERLRGEGLVELDQVEVLDADARHARAPGATRGSGRAPMIAGSTPATAEATMRAIGRRPSSRARASPRRGGRPRAVVDPGAVAGRDRAAVALERRLQRRQRLERGVGVAGAHRDRRPAASPLPFGTSIGTISSAKRPASMRGGGALLARQCEFVLLLARDAASLDDVLGRLAHRVRVVRARPGAGSRSASRAWCRPICVASRGMRSEGLAMTNGARVMISTPAGDEDLAVADGDRVRGAEFTAWRPEPHSRLTVCPPTSIGKSGQERGHPRRHCGCPRRPGWRSQG